MRKILGAIFGSSENTTKVVDGAIAGIDKMIFTDEEKAEANSKVRDWFLKYLAATQPQNLARRLIAVIVVALWALLIVVGIAVYKWDVAYSLFVFETLRDVVNTPFSIIIGFYFAAHLARAWNDKK